MSRVSMTYSQSCLDNFDELEHILNVGIGIYQTLSMLTNVSCVTFLITVIAKQLKPYF